MSQLNELVYSNETAIVVEIIIAIQGIVIIIAKEEQAALRIAFPWFPKFRKEITAAPFLLPLYLIAVKLPSWKGM